MENNNSMSTTNKGNTSKQNAPILASGKPSRKLEAGLDTIRDLMKGAVARKLMPGGGLLLAQHGEIIFEEYIGLADREESIPYSPDTITFYGSNSKPLSATAIMTLVDSGRIALDDQVSKYLPEFGDLKLRGTNEHVDSPTIRQCLSMSSGIFGNSEATATQFGILRQIDLTLADTVALIVKEALNAPPGTYYSYSGASYQVVGRIVEVVTGKPFEVFFRDCLSGPLGFKDMQFMNEPIDEKRWSRLETVYSPSPQGTFEIAVKMPANAKGNLTLVPGAIIGTCRDYLSFLQMHLNGGSYGKTKIISNTLVNEMRRMHTAKLGRSGTGTVADDYGIAWFISRTDDKDMARVYQHAGHWGTYGWIDLDRDMVGFWTTNLPLAATTPILERIYNRVLDVFPGQPAPFMRLTAPATGATKPPVIDELQVNPAVIKAGESAALSFHINGLDLKANIEPGIGNLGVYSIGFTEIKGVCHVSPGVSTTYKLVASNPVGEVTQSITLTVK